MVDYEYYMALYGREAVKEAEFNRLLWDASRKVENYTTGADGVNKLKLFFPTDRDSAESVKRCICKLIDAMHRISIAEEAASGYISRADGTVQGKVVTSISAGNESISFSADKNNAIGRAVSDMQEREAIYRNIIQEYLSGVKDSNGINLLYMGRYR